MAGKLDTILPPRVGHLVAVGIPRAEFEVETGEAYQPFQEIPGEFNARVDASWRQVDAAD